MCISPAAWGFVEFQPDRHTVPQPPPPKECEDHRPRPSAGKFGVSGVNTLMGRKKRGRRRSSKGNVRSDWISALYGETETRAARKRERLKRKVLTAPSSPSAIGPNWMKFTKPAANRSPQSAPSLQKPHPRLQSACKEQLIPLQTSWNGEIPRVRLGGGGTGESRLPGTPRAPGAGIGGGGGGESFLRS